MCLKNFHFFDKPVKITGAFATHSAHAQFRNSNMAGVRLSAHRTFCISIYSVSMMRRDWLFGSASRETIITHAIVKIFSDKMIIRKPRYWRKKSSPSSVWKLIWAPFKENAHHLNIEMNTIVFTLRFLFLFRVLHTYWTIAPWRTTSPQYLVQ